MQTDHLISVRKQDPVIINKKRKRVEFCGLFCPGLPKSETERKWKEN